MFLSLLKFTAVIAGFVYLPGSLIVRRFFKKDVSLAEVLGTSLVIGILINTEIYNVLGLLGLEIFFPLVIFMLASLGIIIRHPSCQKKEKRVISGWLFILILIQFFLIVTDSWFKSGIMYEDGLRFYAPTYDATCYLSLIGEMTRPRPYQYPNFAGELLRGYHYGFHQFTAIIYSLTGISIFDLFFRLMPLFFALLTMLVIFVAAKQLSGNSAIGLIAVVFIFFTGDLCWLMNLFGKNPVVVIGLDPGRHPATIFGVILFLSGLYFMEKANFLACLTWGMAFKFTAYYAPVILGALFLSIFVTQQKKVSLKFFIITALVSLYAYLQVNKFGQAKLFKLYPGYFWLEVVSGIFSFELSRANLSLLSPLKLVGLFLSGFFIYNFLLLGIKIIAIPLFLKQFRFRKLAAGNRRGIIFCQTALILSFAFANLFIRATRGVHNTGFFLEPFLLIFNIYAAWACIEFFSKLDFKKAGLLLILLIFGLAGVFFKFNSIAFRDHIYMLIDRDECEAVSFLKKVMLSEDVIAHFRPSMPWYNERLGEKIGKSHRHRQLFISSLTERRVMLEGASFVIETGGIHNIWDKLREREHIDLIETKDWRVAKHKLKSFSIDYIWLEENEKFSFAWEKILKKVFSNKKITIYEVI